MPSVPVTKMHGTLNDFVLVDCRTRELPNPAAFARQVCDRHAGVGADGLILVLPSQSAAVKMRIFNPDGTEAESCGNGIRCVARYVREHGGPGEISLETLAGTLHANVVSFDPFEVRVDMGVPKVDPAMLAAAGVKDAYCVTLGNPHVVLFVSALADVDLAEIGPKLSAKFPTGANVHAAVRAGPQRLLVRHYERGAGLTMACGTGAVACAAAGITLFGLKSPVEVNVPGGRLQVEWDGAGSAFLTGPAAHVFDADVAIDGERATLAR